MAQLLRVYNNSPFGINTLVHLNDYFVGNGLDDTFTLLNKLGYQLGETVQVAGSFYNRFNGSLTVAGNDFTLNAVPLVGDVITAPGSTKVVVMAYDQATVEGDPSPRVKQYPFYIAPDSSASIQNFKFISSPTFAGIRFDLVDKDSGNGAALSWLEIALANPDGTPGTYQSASTPLLFPEIIGVSTFDVAAAINDTTITVDDGSEFAPGDYLILEPGTLSEEQVKCTAILGNNLTVTPLGYAHLVGATVYQYGLKGWIRTNIPINASGGNPVNFNEIAPRLRGSIESRI